MPCDYDVIGGHRERSLQFDALCLAAVARKIKLSEVEQEPEAKAAVDKEFHKLATMPHHDSKGTGV